MQVNLEVSEQILNKIKGLHKDKIAINDHKIKELGYINIDDHGFVLYPDFSFEPEPNHEKGFVHGAKAIGQNFRKFLNTMPVYINENSALASCWIGYIQDYMKLGIVPEDRNPRLDQIWNDYKITQSGFGTMNHLGPDITIGLKLGWGGLLDKVRHYRDRNQPADTGFYDGEEQLLLGIQEWVGAHGAYGRYMAEETSDEDLKDQYLKIAEMNEWLVNNPPRTLHEACQFIAHFQSVDRTYFAGGALCQLDEVLRPYYEKDMAEGILTDEEAIWYVASLFFNDTHYSQIGGMRADGSGDMTGPMSFIILEAMHLLGIPANIALRVHDGLNRDLFRKSVEYNIEDGTGVDYSLNVGCEEGYMKNGFTREEARQRAKVGCNWTALPGTEYPLQDVSRCNMASALSVALEEMRQKEDKDLELLWDRFTHHLRIMIDSMKEGYDLHVDVVSRNIPEIVLNLFMHGPIERGLNCASGGVDNLSICMDGIALATVADSFAAIEQRIETEQRITWDEMLEALANNYEGAEDIRLMLKNIHRFGSPNSVAEKWALKIKNYFVDYALIPTPKHGIKVIPGLFSHGDVYAYGNLVPATPNGRFDKDPISHSSEPDPGFAQGIRSFSPTLKATAVAKVQPGYGNSAPLHLDIDTHLIEQYGGVDTIMALIDTHNHMGGTLINLNCLSKERLMEAHEDPSKHPDLVVRVTGYSAFFSSLSKEYRQQIVDRYLA